MPSVYDYLDYRKYLKDVISKRIEANPSYSVRAFAKNIGLSATLVNRILNGHRNISKATLPFFLSGLHLSEKEGEYFELLVSFNQAKIAQYKRIGFDQIMHFRRLNLKRLQPIEYEFYHEWYHSVIREILSMMPESQVSSAQIAKRLIPEISAREARKSIRLLQKIGLIKKSNGKFIQTDAFISTGLKWESSIINAFQLKMAELGVEAIERFPKNQRDISTLTVSLSAESLERIKALIKSVRDNILEEAKTGGDRVYQINFQVFPVSK
jgi:uncharacterized protein (TIGR02147 family)